MKKFNLAWLLIVPAIVLAFNFFFVKNTGKMYMNWTDPSYAYLMNGLNLASGKMEIGHVDHPGTTVQVTSALIIKLTHAVAGKNPDIATDVLSDPERYLHIISFIFVVGCGIVMFYLGLVIYRISNSIPTAIFFQSGILVSFTTLTSMADVRPEPFLIIGNLFLMMVCFSFIHEKEISPKRMYAYSLKFALILSFMLVTKMTSIPLLILPLFLLPKWKSWLVYAAGMVVFTLLFLIPALPKMGFLFTWVHNLFTHAGQYGSGEAKIIDVSSFKANLWYTFSSDTPFLLTSLLMIIGLLALIFTRKFTFKTWKESVRLRLFTGVILVTAACVLMVAKQFKFHYLIPAYGFMMLGSFLGIQYLFSASNKFTEPFKKKVFQLVGVLLMVGCITYHDLGQCYFSENFENPKVETARVMSNYKNIPRIYMTYEYYFAEVPPAIFFGCAYAGDCRFDYYKKLNRIYPDAYFYSIPEKSFHKWGATFDLEDLVRKNKQVLVSFYIQDSILINESLDALYALNRGHKVVEIKKVFVNPISGEQLYELNRIAEIKELPDSAFVITCDAEQLRHGSLISTDESSRLQGAEVRSSAYAHSGISALQLTPKDPYGFGYNLEVKPNRTCEISVWRKSESDKGVIQATGMNGKFNLSSSSVVEEGENGWVRIRLKFVVPADYTDSTIKVFAWGENQTGYFDDFVIAEF